MTIASAIFLLFLIMDPFANVPIFLGLLKNLPAPRRRAIIIRELLIALLILLIFMFSGKYILQLLQIIYQFLSTKFSESSQQNKS